METVITFATDDDTITITGTGVYEGPTYDKLEGWYGLPNIGLGIENRPDAPGAYVDERSYADEAAISVEGQNFAATAAESLEMQERLVAIFNDGRPVLMTVTDELRATSRQVMVDTINVPWSARPFIEYTIDVIAEDPRRYGAPNVASTGLPQPGSGLALPFDAARGLLLPSDEPRRLGIDLGTLGEGGRLTVKNEGRAESSTVFTVTGGSMPDGYAIVNVTTGQRITYPGAVRPGLPIIIDTGARSATIAGTTPAVLAAPEWWQAPRRSEHEVAFIARGPVTGRPVLTATTAPAWY